MNKLVRYMNECSSINEVPDRGLQMCKKEEIVLNCPLGGDETNDCEGCPYSGDYHFVGGECVSRKESSEILGKHSECKRGVR